MEVASNGGPAESYSSGIEQKKALAKDKAYQYSQGKGIPLVRLKDLPTPDNEGGLLLTAKQKKWMHTPCYDVYTENPVQYRYTTEASKPSKKELEDEEDRDAVLKLSDEYISKDPSGGLEKTAKRKRSEYLELANQIDEELTASSNEFEVLVKTTAENARVQLAKNSQEIEKVLPEARVPEKLYKLKRRDLMDLWSHITELFSCREAIAKDLLDKFNAIERDRVKVAQEILTRYAFKLKRVGYLLPDQLEQLIEQEGIAVNLSVLANKKQYIKVYKNILTGSVTMEKDRRIQWEDLVDEWKMQLNQSIHQDFEEFMSGKVIRNTDEEQLLKDQFLSGLHVVARKRTEIMDRICSLSPPAINDDLLHALMEDISNAYNEFNAVHSKYLFELHGLRESIQSMCEAKMESIKIHLINFEMCDDSSSYDMITSDLLPRVVEHLTELKEKTFNDEKQLDAILIAQKETFWELFEFVQKLSDLWTEHNAELKSCGKELMDKLDGVRSSHDEVNQNLEANLDLVLDRLRQSATQEALERYMNEALGILNTIRTGYDTFKTSMLDQAEAYPDTVQELLDGYEASLLPLLGVKRVAVSSSRSAQRLAFSESRGPHSSSSSSSKKLIRTSHGHTFKVVSNISKHFSDFEASENDLSSGTGKRKTIWIEGGSRKEKVRFDTGKKSSSQDSTKKKEELVKQKKPQGVEIEEGRKIRISKNMDERVTKGKKGGKKSGLKGGGDKGLRVDRKSSSDQYTDEEESSGTFMTQIEEAEEDTAAGVVSMKKQALQKVLFSLRLNFLEHLDSWIISQVESANRIAIDKKEEVLTELDLRLHLHEPRPMRITKDIHDVRAAELVMHGERLQRHATAIADTLSDLKEGTNSLSTKLEEQLAKFTADIGRIDFSGVKDLKLLEQLKEDVHKILQKHLDNVRGSCQKHRKSITAEFDTLSQSNTKYKASVKLFKDGGNYCPEEEDVFSRKLERIGDKISSSRQLILGYLAQVKEDYLQRSHEAMEIFNETYKVYCEEFTFLASWRKSIVSLHITLKGEVAGCGGKAQYIKRQMQALKEAINGARNKVIAPSELLDKVAEVFRLLSERATFLQANQTVDDLHEEQDDGYLKKPISTINIIQSITGHQGTTATSKAGVSGMDRKRRNTLKPPSPFLGATDQGQDNLSSKETPAHGRLNSQSSILSKHRTRKRSMLDKFGGEPKDLSSCFLPNIKRILRGKVADLGKEGENFYLIRSQTVNGQARINYRQIRSNHVPVSIDSFLVQVEEEIDKHHSQMEKQRWKFIQEFKVQCEEVVILALEVPEVVYSDLRETHCNAARDCWQGNSLKIRVDMQQIHEKQVQLERRLKPSLGRPDRTNDMDELNEKEEKIHDAALETIEKFKTTAHKCQQIVLKDFLMDLCETTKSLLSLMDEVTPAKKVKEDPSVPKPRPKMEDLVRQNVAENIIEVTGSSGPSSHPMGRHHKQDVIVTKSTGGDMASHASKRGGDGTQVVSTRKRKVSGNKQPVQSAEKGAIGSGPQNIFKNNWFYWNQLPLDTISKFLVESGPARVVSPAITVREGSREELSDGRLLSSSMNESMDVFKEALKTKMSTELHDMVITCRDKVFENFIGLHMEILSLKNSMVEENIMSSHQSHQRWNTSVRQIQQLYSMEHQLQ